MNYEIINEKKKLLGLKNQVIADKTGITLSTMDKITSGINQNPKLETLQAIAKVVGCTLNDFAADKKEELSAAALRIARIYDNANDKIKAAFEAVAAINEE